MSVYSEIGTLVIDILLWPFKFILANGYVALVLPLVLSACGGSSNNSPVINGQIGAAAAISEDNHIEVIGLVFDIYTGNAYRENLLNQPAYSDNTFQKLPFGNPDDWVTVDLTCNNGGSALMDPIAEYDGFRFYTTGWDFLFNQCQDDADVFDGQVRREYLGGGASQWKVRANDVSINAHSKQLDYTGLAVLFGGGRSAEWQRSWEVSDLDYSLSDSESNLILTNVNTQFYYYTSLPSVGSAGMDGSFNVVSNVTGQSTLSAKVIQAFGVYLNNPNATEDTPWSFETGVLEVSASDGSKLVMTADNGDYQTVLVTISTSDGLTQDLTQPWSLWEENLRDTATYNYWFN